MARRALPPSSLALGLLLLSLAHHSSALRVVGQPSRRAVSAARPIHKPKLHTRSYTRLSATHQLRGHGQQHQPAVRAASMQQASGVDWAARQEAVREAIVHSWSAYEQYAWGHDTLQPLSKDGKDDLGGLGATIIDSLSTLWLVGLHQEFKRARDWVATSLRFDQPLQLSLFETNIRIVGGLLSAYDLSADAMFLAKAEELVALMLPNFDEGGVGLPRNDLLLGPLAKLPREPSGPDETVAVAEIGTLSLEFVALSQRTGNATYAQKALRITEVLRKKNPRLGMMPVWINRADGRVTSVSEFTVGGMGDSYFEYLLKTWLLSGKKEELLRDMWERSMDDVVHKLLRVSKRGLSYVGQLMQGGVHHPKMGHLACYLPGNLALGATSGAVKPKKAARYMQVARDLTNTCFQMYERMPTGLAPEEVFFHPLSDMVPAAAHWNWLRPETVESMFYLWRLTGDEQYRDWAWQIFEAFQKHCRAETGYAGLQDVNHVPPVKDNAMQSFWLAETLKYLWLIGAPTNVLALDQWVFNTEAHPLRLGQHIM
ncbi:hypothetical protein WJX72_010173 [[Myrmecia] bisecta]|uniref:alpha-1,2-Mannosidase n=1 Tax=[Myrmecia] bisecta TaxID=41462 RepID=A0AAW1PYP6_9CHLO